MELARRRRGCKVKSRGSSGWEITLVAALAIGMLCGCPGPAREAPPEVVIQPAPPPVEAPVWKPPLQGPAQPPGKPAPPASIPPPPFSGPPTLRIWLSDAPAEPEISCAGPCRVHPDTGPAKRVVGLARAEAGILPGGIRLGDQIYKCSSLELQAEGGGRIRVGDRAYAGTVRLLRGADRVVAVNALDMESYLLGVVGAEMPSDWPREALRAQAVAARTYALYFQLQRAAFEWDVTNTMEDQVYGGRSAKASIADAVNATRGQVLLHDGGVFPAFFHSTCGGQTESPGEALGKPEYDFLEGVPCGFCRASPHYQWSARIAAKDLVAKLRSSGIAVGPVTAVSAVAGEDLPALQTPGLPAGRLAGGQAAAGYVGRSVRLVWPGGEIAAPIKDFRRAVGTLTIQSGKFECRAQGDEFLFTGHGLGHGAGMCQYGCKGMAEAGRSYGEILMHYYRHTSLQKLY